MYTTVRYILFIIYLFFNLLEKYCLLFSNFGALHQDVWTKTFALEQSMATGDFSSSTSGGIASTSTTMPLGSAAIRSARGGAVQCVVVEDASAGDGDLGIGDEVVPGVIEISRYSSSSRSSQPA